MIKSRKPLRRSTNPIKRSPIKRKPPRKKSTEQKQSALARNKANGYSRYWRDKGDALWSFLVRFRAQGYCEYSDRNVGFERLNAHHLIRRARGMTRHSLDNGIAIWQIFHRRDYVPGPHGAESWRFDRWLLDKRPKQAYFMEVHKNDAGRPCWHDNYIALLEAAQEMGCMDEVKKRKLWTEAG